MSVILDNVIVNNDKLTLYISGDKIVIRNYKKWIKDLKESLKKNKREKL